MSTGKGTAEALVQAAREQRAAKAARHQRSEEIDALLAGEGLQDQRWRVLDLQRWVYTGEGGSAEAMLAARSAAAEQGRIMQRQQRMQELLEAEGLEGQRYCDGVDAWVGRGEGSEGEALSAARQTADEAARRIQRRNRLTELLAAEGINYGLIGWDPTVRAYVDREGAGMIEALAAARAAFEPHRQQQQRRERLTAVLMAEGIDFYQVGSGCAWQRSFV